MTYPIAAREATASDHLFAALRVVQLELCGRAEQDPELDSSRRERDRLLQQLGGEAPLVRLERACGLTAFELNVVLCAAGPLLSDTFARAVGELLGDTGPAAPNVRLLLARLPGAHWSATLPESPLQRYALVQVPGGSTSAVDAPLALDAFVLHFLLGLSPYTTDARLEGAVRPLEATAPCAPSQERIATELAAGLRHGLESGIVPLLRVAGENREDKPAVVARAARTGGWAARELRLDALPPPGEALQHTLRLLNRLTRLRPGIWYVVLDGFGGLDAARQRAIESLLSGLEAAVAYSGDRFPGRTDRPELLYQVPGLTRNEQAEIWEAAAPAGAADVARLTETFELSASGIHRLAASARLSRGEATGPDEDFWDRCRDHSRNRMAGLAERLIPDVGWDDLILPAGQLGLLHAICDQVRHRKLVYRDWGFTGEQARGRGISALFAGQSGTGKTLAAEVLAAELQLDLYRVDLSRVVDKYIGETEKNLARLFDAAEGSGAILLFDEADALFGRRSEVKDSHDRYANQEVSYLLQRMESYRGLAVLTTNLRNALDPAFLRRLRFVVHFPFPGRAERAAIWRRAFPPRAPLRDVDYARLARLDVAGGNIRNIALNAAFRAAGHGRDIGMDDLQEAAQQEYAKLEKAMSTGERLLT